jgi:hypothetical protein
MANLTDEQRRALRILARHPQGCAETVLLEQGFTYDQLGALVFDSLAIMRPSVTYSGGRAPPESCALSSCTLEASLRTDRTA